MCDGTVDFLEQVEESDSKSEKCSRITKQALHTTSVIAPSSKVSILKTKRKR